MKLTPFSVLLQLASTSADTPTALPLAALVTKRMYRGVTSQLQHDGAKLDLDGFESLREHGSKIEAAGGATLLRRDVQLSGDAVTWVYGICMGWQKKVRFLLRGLLPSSLTCIWVQMLQSCGNALVMMDATHQTCYGPSGNKKEKVYLITLLIKDPEASIGVPAAFLLTSSEAAYVFMTVFQLCVCELR